MTYLYPLYHVYPISMISPVHCANDAILTLPHFHHSPGLPLRWRGSARCSGLSDPKSLAMSGNQPRSKLHVPSCCFRLSEYANIKHLHLDISWQFMIYRHLCLFYTAIPIASWRPGGQATFRRAIAPPKYFTFFWLFTLVTINSNHGFLAAMDRIGSVRSPQHDDISRIPDSFQLHPLVDLVNLVVGINSYSLWPHVHHLWFTKATGQRCRTLKYPRIIPSHTVWNLHSYHRHPEIIQTSFTSYPCLAVRCDTTAAAWFCHVARPGGEMSDGELVSFIEAQKEQVSNFSIYFGVNLND